MRTKVCQVRQIMMLGYHRCNTSLGIATFARLGHLLGKEQESCNHS